MTRVHATATARPDPRGTPTALVAALTLAVAAAMFALASPIPQDPAYHHFADRRTFLGIPNFGDVASNLPFAVVGLWGLGLVTRAWRSNGRPAFVDPRERWCWAVLFAGVALTSVGSAYYHWAPDNARLVWDRLPMTLGFMGALAAVIAERVGLRTGLALLGPLLVLGLASVWLWHRGEQVGAGDLRLYVLVQLYPLVAIPLLMALFPPRYSRGGDLLLAALVYVAAKGLELADATVYARGGVVSGHTLKHLTSAAAIGLILGMLARRVPVAPPSRPRAPSSAPPV